MEKYDADGKVICQECGKSYMIISRHLLKHNMNAENYKEKYPGFPISSAQFSAKMKYGKIKMFKKDKDVEPTVEEIIVDEEPEIEEMDQVEIIKPTKSKGLIHHSKEEILDLLLTYFPNVKKDYMISKYFIDKRLEYEFITDFCDPTTKVVIDFPKVFWHNIDRYINFNRDSILEQDGWKVININSASYIDIQKRLST